MYNSISGEITYKDGEKVLLLRDGIEWEILTSGKSSQHLPEIGEPGKVFTYLHHREDQLILFGFSSTEERHLFLDLIKVEGVGPKLGVKILSGIEVGDFIAAVDANDIDLLSTIPGLGKKTAQKIVLKLKGRLAVTERPHESLEKDIVTALVGMGFDRNSAVKAVQTALKNIDVSAVPKKDLEKELFRNAIELVSRGNLT